MILLSLKPAVRLPPKLDSITLNFEGKTPKKVVISKIEKTISGSRIQSGFSLRVFLSAENLKEAINEAKSFADGSVSFIIEDLIETAKLVMQLTQQQWERVKKS